MSGLKAQDVGDNIVFLVSGQDEIRHSWVRRLQPYAKCSVRHSRRLCDTGKTWCHWIRRSQLTFPHSVALSAYRVRQRGALLWVTRRLRACVGCQPDQCNCCKENALHIALHSEVFTTNSSSAHSEDGCSWPARRRLIAGHHRAAASDHSAMPFVECAFVAAAGGFRCVGSYAVAIGILPQHRAALAALPAREMALDGINGQRYVNVGMSAIGPRIVGPRFADLNGDIRHQINISPGICL